RLKMLGFAAFVLAARSRSFSEQARIAASRWFYEMDVSIAAAVDAQHWLTSAVRSAVKRDRIAFLQGLADQIAVTNLKDPLRLYAVVRRAFPKAKASWRASFQALPAVRLLDGTLAKDPTERADRWTTHFGDQEAGKVTALADYETDLRASPFQPALGGPHFDIMTLPSLMEVEQQIVRLPPRKAAGPDSITAETLRVCPTVAARSFLPLFLKFKVSLSLREPTPWRGGHLMCLAKRATALLDCEAFRSILLASLPAKIFHRLWRDRLSRHLGHVKGDLQAGQLPGVGVDSIALAVRTYQAWAKHQGLKSGLLFFDVKAAFYKVVRQALVQTEPDDAGLICLLQDLGVPGDALPELAQKLQAAAYIAEAGASPHLQAQITDLLRGTWFRLDGSASLAVTARGSLPGDPLADILFSFSFAAYLKGAEQALAARGLATPAASQASELCDRVLQAAEVLSEHATAAGMQLTFAPDKTAVMLASDCELRSETRLVKDDTGRPGFYVQNAILQCRHFLPLVASYKHLGGILTSNATPGADNQFRFSQAQATLRPLYGRLFSATGIPLAIRRTLLRALVISKFVFSGASSLLVATTYRRQWCQMYVLLWRGLCRWAQRDRAPHSYEVLQRAHAASPLLALAQMRAVLLQRILKHGPDTLLHLLHVHWREAGAKSCLGLFVEDLHAVAPFAPAAATVLSMPDPVETLLEKASDEPAWWPAQVRKAVKGFTCRLEKWEPGLTPAATQMDVPDPLPFVCRWCNAAFRLRKHLAVHEARRHGSLCPARHYTPTRECLACLKLFHSVERCLYHVKTSRSCLLRLVHLLPPMDLPTIRLAEQEDSLRRKALRRGQWQAFVSTTPVAQAFGPKAPVYSDIFLGLSEDETPISRLGFYRPPPATLQWILDYIEGAS
ncbi:unnamed protein product, partial [Symbiodinium sp. CCMP2456]